MHEPQQQPTWQRTVEAEPPAARPKPGTIRCVAGVAIGVLALATLAPASDKGLIVVRAGSPEEVHAMMAQDPSIGAGTFRYAVHPFAVFYPGTVEGRPRE
jgi:hypothetical protein